MLVRLRDFAELHRISERTVQVHIKNNQEELEGHIERRGKQGTWLDEFAVNFLLDRIQLPTKDEVLMPTPREAALMMQLSDANRQLAEAERAARENAEAAGKVKFLEAAKGVQDAQIVELSAKVGQLTEKVAIAAEDAQRVREALTEARDELTAAREREGELRAYLAAMEAWNALSKWKRRKKKKYPRPVAPAWFKEG